MGTVVPALVRRSGRAGIIHPATCESMLEVMINYRWFLIGEGADMDDLLGGRSVGSSMLRC